MTRALVPARRVQPVRVALRNLRISVCAREDPLPASLRAEVHVSVINLITRQLEPFGQGAHISHASDASFGTGAGHPVRAHKDAERRV